MAKLKSKTIELTPEMQAEADAKALLEHRRIVLEHEAKIQEIEDRLEDYYKITGYSEIAGVLSVQERNNPPRIEGATGKRLEMLKERLIRELPVDYIKESKSLDLSRMDASLDSDPVLRAMLHEAGLRIERKTTIVFKAITA